MDIKNRITNIAEKANIDMLSEFKAAMGDNKEFSFTKDYGFESLVDDDIMYINPIKLYYGADDKGNGNDTLHIVYESDNETFDEVLNVLTIDDLILLGDIMQYETNDD